MSPSANHLSAFQATAIIAATVKCHPVRDSTQQSSGHRHRDKVNLFTQLEVSASKTSIIVSFKASPSILQIETHVRCCAYSHPNLEDAMALYSLHSSSPSCLPYSVPAHSTFAKPPFFNHLLLIRTPSLRTPSLNTVYADRDLSSLFNAPIHSKDPELMPVVATSNTSIAIQIHRHIRLIRIVSSFDHLLCASSASHPQRWHAQDRSHSPH